MESLRISALLSLICTAVACGCGGCNYASDLACARCCTAYVRREANILTFTAGNRLDQTPSNEGNLQWDAFPIKYHPQARFFSRSGLKSSLNLRTPSDDNTAIFDFISRASELRRLMDSKFADMDSAIKIRSYLDLRRSSGKKAPVAKHSEPSHGERTANNAQWKPFALQAIVQELYN